MDRLDQERYWEFVQATVKTVGKFIHSSQEKEAPEGETLAESNHNVSAIAEVFARKMETQRTRLLWGTANLFSNRRYMWEATIPCGFKNRTMGLEAIPS